MRERNTKNMPIAECRLPNAVARWRCGVILFLTRPQRATCGVCVVVGQAVPHCTPHSATHRATVNKELRFTLLLASRFCDLYSSSSSSSSSCRACTFCSSRRAFIHQPGSKGQSTLRQRSPAHAVPSEANMTHSSSTSSTITYTTAAAVRGVPMSTRLASSSP